jgi:hypothetical protein
MTFQYTLNTFHFNEVIKLFDILLNSIMQFYIIHTQIQGKIFIIIKISSKFSTI